jgi:hypothetical protein
MSGIAEERREREGHRGRGGGRDGRNKQFSELLAKHTGTRAKCIKSKIPFMRAYPFSCDMVPNHNTVLAFISHFLSLSLSRSLARSLRGGFGYVEETSLVLSSALV